MQNNRYSVTARRYSAHMICDVAATSQVLLADREAELSVDVGPRVGNETLENLNLFLTSYIDKRILSNRVCLHDRPETSHFVQHFYSNRFFHSKAG